MQAFHLWSRSIRIVAIVLGVALALNITPRPAAAIDIPTLKLPWGVGDKDGRGSPIYLTSGPHGAPINFACDSNESFNTASFRTLTRLSGLDFNMSQGTSVLAAAGGWVVFAGPPAATDPRGPNVVALDHGNGFMTQYWHLSSVDPAMIVNRWVNQGTRVGGSGISGTGQHLHLEFRSYRHPDSPVYFRDSSPGLPYPIHGLALGALSPAGLPSNYVAWAEIHENVLQGVNYDGTLTRGNASSTNQTICSNNVTVTNWTGADGTVWASANGGNAAIVTGSNNGPSTQSAITVDDVWMADGSGPVDRNAPRKTTFNAGQSIRFWAKLNNHRNVNLTSNFSWTTGGPRKLFAINTNLSVRPGVSWWYYTLGSLPSTSWGGNYLFRALNTTGGISDGLSRNLTLNLQTPKIYIMLSWNSFLRDLDAHLWGPAHIYFGNPGTLNASPNAALDIDDNSNGGLETIGISNRSQLTYTYAVYNWANVRPLKGQLVAVRVKIANQWREYQVPTTGEGRWWNVFQINPNGSITDINTISATPPVSSIAGEQGFERIDEHTVKPVPSISTASDILHEWQAP